MYHTLISRTIASQTPFRSFRDDVAGPRSACSPRPTNRLFSIEVFYHPISTSAFFMNADSFVFGVAPQPRQLQGYYVAANPESLVWISRRCPLVQEWPDADCMGLIITASAPYKPLLLGLPFVCEDVERP